MKQVYIGLLSLILISCGGGKKQTLADKEEPIGTVAQRDSLQESSVVYNAAKKDSISIQRNSEWGRRITSANNPPAKISLWRTDLKPKKVDLAEHYQKVKYVKLKHPLNPDEGNFLGDASADVYERGGMLMASGLNSLVFLLDDKIVAGDEYFGYHVYDLSGKFIYTLAQVDKLPEYDRVNNKLSLERDETNSQIFNLSVLKNKALIDTKEDKSYKVHIYDLDRQKGDISVSIYANGMLVDENTLLSYNTYPQNKKAPFMMTTTVDAGVGIRTSFMNYNPPVEIKGSYVNPELTKLYYYNDVLSVRQAYNDTIYRFKSPTLLESAFVLDMGSKKLTTKDAFTGSKEGKLILLDWIETDDFIYIACSENHDTPNNRKAGTVKFVYYYYDKKEKELYNISSSSYPENVVLGSSLDETIPLIVSTVNISGKKLYASFTKNQLDAMIKDESFATFSEAQQQKIKDLSTTLDEQELLVLILE